MKLHRIQIICILILLSTVMRAENAAEIINCSCSVVLRSPTEARYTFSRRVTVNNEKGERLGVFAEVTDRFSAITSFSGTVESGGKVIRKLKKQDITTVQYSQSLIDDTYANYFSPDAPYPYTVEYNYVITVNKAVATFPSFVPVSTPDIALKNASYSISMPCGQDLNFKASDAPVTTDDGKTATWKWEWKDYPGYKNEDNMPSYTEVVPYVFATPVDFVYDGSKGRQDSWKDVGQWLYSIFPANLELPEELKVKVHAMTDPIPDAVGKIRALYGYLRDNTRYVSIQLGIGGYAPMSPAEVCRTGYGDCKALSFLMRQMLGEIGIQSEYFIVNTDRSDLFEDYTSIGQMNHAMLCVPMQKDSLWIECTNQDFPLGFRHDGVAGHQVVLVDSQGGTMVRASSYPDSLSHRTDSIRIRITELSQTAGRTQCHVRVRQHRNLDDATQYIKLQQKPRKQIVSFFADDFDCLVENLEIASIKDNFMAYTGQDGYYPKVTADISFTSPNIARNTAGRIFLPLAPTRYRLRYQKTPRVHRFIRNAYTDIEIITEYEIPEGYRVEMLPEASGQECFCGKYSIEAAVKGNTITTSYRIVLDRCNAAAPDYILWKDFAKEHNRACESPIILVKE